MNNAISTGQIELKGLFDTIEYRVARSPVELEKAYLLVYKEYLKRGYVKESSSGLKLSIFNALPQTTTFVTLLENEIFCTATLIPDSSLGLPMDEIYTGELSELRRQNKRLCEISMLASDTELFKNGVSMMLNSKKMFFIFYLFKVIFDYAMEFLKLDCICITINPKHKLTYDFLLFKDLGDLKTYKNANGAPAVAKYLDLKTVEKECKNSNKEGLYRMFLSRKTDPDKFSRKVIFDQQGLKYFFVEKTDVFKDASSFQLEYIKQSYSKYDFINILKTGDLR